MSRDSTLTHNLVWSLISRDYVASNSWNLGFHRNLNDLESNEFASLMSLIENFSLQDNDVDYRVWLKESLGCFSCHSFFNFILESVSNTVDESWKFIWKDDIPSKVKVLVWVAFKRKLNTYDLLQKGRPSKCLSPYWCVLCKSTREDIDHLFLHCFFTL